MNKISQVFIFAAGRGERMRPLTDSIPKPLAQVHGKSIIDHILAKLDQISSIEKIIINGFYLADKLQNHLNNLQNPKIIFSYEKEKLETGGGLVFASDKIDFSQPLLTINGDVFWQENSFSDLNFLMNSFNKNECDILLGLKKKEEFFGYDGKGDFNLDDSGNVNFGSNYAYTGLQVINPKILQNIEEKCFSVSHFYRSAKLIDGHLQSIKAIELKGKYFHIGTVSALQQMNNFFDLPRP